MVDEEHANLGSKVFFIWGSCCFVCITFVWFFIYETKGLSLEEVDELYGIVDKAWQSKRFRPAVRFSEVEEDGERGRGASLADIAAEQQRRRSTIEADGEKGAGEKTQVVHA